MNPAAPRQTLPADDRAVPFVRAETPLPTGMAPRAALWRRASRPLALLALCGLTLAATFQTGCLFDPREAGDPGTGGEGVRWVDPTTLGDALGNMERALEAKQLSNYGRSFNEGGPFELVFDVTDEAELGDLSLFENWTGEKEEQRMDGIIDAAGEATEVDVEWLFTAETDSIDESVSQRYYKDLGYSLTFTRSGAEATYSGSVDLWFEDNGSGLWYISRWVDKRTHPTNNTWGWLRARNTVEF